MQPNNCCPNQPVSPGFMRMGGEAWDLCYGCNNAFRRDPDNGAIVRTKYTTYMASMRGQDIADRYAA